MLFGATAQGQWKQIAQLPDRLQCIYFLDQVGHPEIGLAGSWHTAQVWRTTDYGISWQSVLNSTPTIGGITDITFKDSLTGWLTVDSADYIGSFGSHVYKTIDGGLTWQQCFTGVQITAIVYHPFSKLLFVSDYSRGIYSSSDEGITWSYIYQKRAASNGYIFLDSVNGIICNEPILRTTDGGKNWNEINPNAIPVGILSPWQPASSLSSKTFFVFSEYTSNLIRSPDLGKSWEFGSTFNISGGFFSGCLRSGECNKLFIQSLLNGFYISFDGGSTWQNIGGPDGTVDMRFWIVKNKIFASDISGGFWIYTDTLSNPILNIYPASINVSSECMKIDTTIFFFACSETIDSFSFSGSSDFSISPEGVIPRSFLSQDSFKVTYKPNGNSFDTSYLTLHFKGSTKGFDTVVKFIGESTLPSSSFLPHLNGFNSNKEILLVPGYDTTIAFSVSNDILSVDSFDSLTFELNFNSEMLHFDSAITPNAWKTSIDEVLPGLLRCTFNNAPHIDILENQPLAFFHFSSYLAKDSISIVSLKAGNAFFDPARKNGCPIESMGQGDSVKIIAVDICSDNNIRNFMIDGKLPEFSIRPNPAENSLTVASSIDLSEASCSVFDQLGRSILRRNVLDFTKDNKVTLDVSGLSSGMYFLRVEANGFSRSQKVVITH